VDLSTRGSEMPASPLRRLAALATDAERRGIRVLRLNIGQPDVPTPSEVLEAARAFRGPVLGYGPSDGLPETRAAIAEYLAGVGSPVAPEDVVVTTGASEAILFALSAVCDPGDEVLVIDPLYANYIGFACMAGVRLVPVAASPEDGYRLPLVARLEAAVGPRTRAVLYSSPSNPSGTVLRRDEVAALVDLAARRDLFLLADEVCREFVYDGARLAGALEVATAAGEAGRVVLLDSISKRFSACGARVGWIATTNTDVRDACLRFGQARLCAPTLGQHMAAAGFRALPRFLPPVIDEFRRRRDVVLSALSRIPGAVCPRPEGAFYVMPRLPIDDADAFAAFLLREFSHGGATVLVAPGTGFYATPGQGRHEVRLAYVLGSPALEAAMDLLVRGVEAYAGLTTRGT